MYDNFILEVYFAFRSYLDCYILYRTPLMRALIQRHWCELLPLQLEAGDYDSIEKVLAAIKASTKDCREAFNKTSLRAKLNKLKDRFTKELDEEEDEDFKSYLRTFPERIDKINNELGKHFSV